MLLGTVAWIRCGILFPLLLEYANAVGYASIFVDECLWIEQTLKFSFCRHHEEKFSCMSVFRKYKQSCLISELQWVLLLFCEWSDSLCFSRKVNSWPGFLTARFFRAWSSPPLQVQVFPSFWNKVMCNFFYIEGFKKKLMGFFPFTQKNLLSTRKYPLVHNENFGALTA